MVDLQELRGALQSLAESGGSAKVSFYYVGADGVALRAGSILVDHGIRAYIDHQQLAPLAAVDSILGLKLVKVASLQMTEVLPAPALIGVDLTALISSLQVAIPLSAPAPVPVPAPSEPMARATATTTEIPAVAEPHVDIAAEAQRLLEPLFGVSTRKKVEEFAKAHPPAEHPYEFLLLCQKQSGVMLGIAKAEALFRPLYDQLASERLQRRR
jgi:hypothetical protein